MKLFCGLLRVFHVWFFVLLFWGAIFAGPGPWDAIGVLCGVWLGHADGAANFFRENDGCFLWY